MLSPVQRSVARDRPARHLDEAVGRRAQCCIHRPALVFGQHRLDRGFAGAAACAALEAGPAARTAKQSIRRHELVDQTGLVRGDGRHELAVFQQAPQPAMFLTIARQARNARPRDEGGRPSLTSVKPNWKILPRDRDPPMAGQSELQRGAARIAVDRGNEGFRRSVDAPKAPRLGGVFRPADRPRRVRATRHPAAGARSRPPTNVLPVPVSTGPLMADVTITRLTAASRS
jgi:hypothetical protein